MPTNITEYFHSHTFTRLAANDELERIVQRNRSELEFEKFASSRQFVELIWKLLPLVLLFMMFFFHSLSGAIASQTRKKVNEFLLAFLSIFQLFVCDVFFVYFFLFRHRLVPPLFPLSYRHKASTEMPFFHFKIHIKKKRKSRKRHIKFQMNELKNKMCFSLFLLLPRFSLHIDFFYDLALFFFSSKM